MSGDEAVAVLYFAAGVGLFFGMMIARRLGTHLEGSRPPLVSLAGL